MLAHQDINSFYENHIDELAQLKKFIDMATPYEMVREVYTLHSRYIQDIETAINRINQIYSSNFNFNRKKSFYDLIVNLEAYQEEAIQYSSTPKPYVKLNKAIPSRGLKDLLIKVCNNLIKKGEITSAVTNPTSVKNLINLVVNYLKDHDYELTPKNEATINDYFRKFILQIKKTPQGKLIVVDKSSSKKKSYNPEQKGL